MAVDAKHPDYIDRIDEWKLMRDCNRGPVAISSSGEKYLPMPSGFSAPGNDAVAMFKAYKDRARFPDIISPTLRGMVGLIHRMEVNIEMPTAMEPLLERATIEGLPLETFHRRITAELLLTGRYGILTDASEEGSDIPFLAGYNTEAIINWDDDGSFFVLDETAPVREGFNWVEKRKFRVVMLENGKYVVRIYDNFGGVNPANPAQPSLPLQEVTGRPQGTPVPGTADQSMELVGGRLITPSKRGTGSLDKVPFVVASATDLSPVPKEVPMIGVARAAIAVYQLDADYRHQLYMSGQETFVTIGLDDPPAYVGASVRLAIPMNGDAKYVGPGGKGIEAHKAAIADAKDDAVAAGAQLFDVQSGDESGEALRLRYAAQTATLTTISQTSSAALEAALRNVALFMGLDPTKVIVKPNLKFVEATLTPEAANGLMKLWMGAAISKETLFKNLQRGEIVDADTTFEDEEEKIAQEQIDNPIPVPGVPGVPGNQDPNNPGNVDPNKDKNTPPADNQA